MAACTARSALSSSSPGPAEDFSESHDFDLLLRRPEDIERYARARAVKLARLLVRGLGSGAGSGASIAAGERSVRCRALSDSFPDALLKMSHG